MITSRKTLTFLVAILFSYGCNSHSNGDKKVRNKVADGKIEITEGWVRAGMKGKSSAAYLTIVNGTESPDTLLGVFTKVAEVAELHGSYENDDGIMSMKPAKQPTIKAGEVVHFEPSGLHIMLMGLNKNLASGDSLHLTLEFAEAGAKKVILPVGIQ